MMHFFLEEFYVWTSSNSMLGVMEKFICKKKVMLDITKCMLLVISTSFWMHAHPKAGQNTFLAVSDILTSVQTI